MVCVEALYTPAMWYHVFNCSAVAPYRAVEPPRTGESYQPYVPTTPVRPPRGTSGDKAEVDRWLAGGAL